MTTRKARQGQTTPLPPTEKGTADSDEAHWALILFCSAFIIASFYTSSLIAWLRLLHIAWL